MWSFFLILLETIRNHKYQKKILGQRVMGTHRKTNKLQEPLLATLLLQQMDGRIKLRLSGSAETKFRKQRTVTMEFHAALICFTIKLYNKLLKITCRNSL